MATDIQRDPDFEWLDMLQPTGLVVGRNLLRELGLVPERQTKVQSAEAEAFIEADTEQLALKDPWGFVVAVLGWETRHVAGSPEGPPLPDALMVRLPEHDTTLAPTWAVRELGGNSPQHPWQLLVRIETGIDPDKRGALAGWEATVHQRFERLLRETSVFAGLMIADKELRLVYAPRGETSGWLSFPIRALATVAGRPMLGGLKLLLDSVRLFTDADERRLPALLKKSRDAQAAVSTALAEQVLGALHELLRGLDAADGARIRALAKTRPGHLYEGLLTVLMRLVFVLYAEDRDLLPSRTDERARELYESGYSVRGLFGRLAEDAALNPDTMDERRGAWGRLLALFRLIHKGHKSHFVQARGGKLFDPDAFPFLEGRDSFSPSSLVGLVGEGRGGGPPRVLPVSDGCILRILEGLMTLKGPNGRERLSYRSLDVEQIGSVYEIVMGFTVETASGRSLAIRAGKNNRTPVFVDLEALLAQKGKDRIKYLKEEADRGQLSATVAKAVEATKTVPDLAAALDAIVDERASPRKHEAAPGTPILQPTDERRRTGSHYTPRSLTEPIVRYALEPAFERLGPDATSDQVLDLKVCDPAMGSGAFLVEACRSIAAMLVRAWERWPAKKPVIPADEDEDLHARRLVAQRCLYGVDKNPLATDLAKLSLWLATLARDHEFTFLDHALKSGDSLVGVTKAQIAAVNWDAGKPGLPLFRQLVTDRIAEAIKGRAEIQAAPDDTARAAQEARHRSLEARLTDIRLMGDAVIAAFFAADKPKAREKKRAEVESWLTGRLEAAWDKTSVMAVTLKQGAHPLTPFHWEIEYPEVFARENGGFDAIFGNPPFLGGSYITRNHGANYFSYLAKTYEGCVHHCDYVGYFVRKIYSLLRSNAVMGLVATKTIAQGDTREGALNFLLSNSGQITRVKRNIIWPGEASVVVVAIHISKGILHVQPFLDDKNVTRISAFLVRGTEDSSPARLSSNPYISQGSQIYGKGFLFDDNDQDANSTLLMNELLSEHPDLQRRILPFLGGEEINSQSDQAPQRYVIFLSDIQEEQELSHLEPLVGIVRDRVLPERMRLRNTNSGRQLKKKWWAYQAHRPKLYAQARALHRVMVNSLVSSHLAFVFVKSGSVFSHKLGVIPSDKAYIFSCVQSRIHELWTRFLSAPVGEGFSYSPTDCFSTFAFPAHLDRQTALEAAGDAYHDHRSFLMIARDEGMTKTYNRFHDRGETAEDIRRLRELHTEMDRAVLEAYGWHDLAERAEPVFLDKATEDDHTYQGRLFWPSDFRDEVLARLLALNAERHAEEVRLGIAPGMKGRAEEDQGDNTDE